MKDLQDLVSCIFGAAVIVHAIVANLAPWIIVIWWLTS